MLFNSTEFIAFFPIVIAIYFLIPKKIKPVWLLLTSYFFYMCWNPKYIVLLLFCTAVTYIAGILIDKNENKSRKKLILTLGIILNFLVLFAFKYLDFALDSLNSVLGLFHKGPCSFTLAHTLPVGISFFTFQAVGYMVDVYRGEIGAEKNFLKYALFVSFFPQLVAGPIERSKNLLTQINKISKERLWSRDKIVSGIGMMIWGFFIKMVIADRAAVYVDSIHDRLYAAGTVETVFAAVLFTLQIYTDFAGYSSIAIGASRIIGIDLMENFNTPFFAENIADFWRRWHISLSTWFRDYLYIPLGGSRCSKPRHILNIMITFLVSGLWHGADWKFVVWGGLHGLYQGIGILLKPITGRFERFTKADTKKFGFRIWKVILTNILVIFAFIFFRAESVVAGFSYVRRMFTKWNPWVLFNDSLYNWGLDHFEMNILGIALLILLAVSIVRYKKNLDFGRYLLTQNIVFRWAVYILLAVFVIVFGQYGIDFDSNQFIYFAF